MRTFMPLYTWKGDDVTWTQRLAELMPGDIVVVTGEQSGAPEERDPVLEHRITQLTELHVHVFGYVPLDYGNRTMDDVLDNMVDWRTKHGVRRYFFDEWPDHWGPDHQGALWGATRAYNGKSSAENPIIALNPGKQVTSLMQYPVPGGLVVTHEESYRPGWAPRNHEVVIVHSVHPDLVKRDRGVLDMAGWRWGYVTSDTLPNPYDGAST